MVVYICSLSTMEAEAEGLPYMVRPISEEEQNKTNCSISLSIREIQVKLQRKLDTVM